MLLTESRRILFEPVDSQSARLLFSSRQNEAGILYRISAVLFVHGWSIDWAHVRTEGDGQVDDVFSIHRIDGAPLAPASISPGSLEQIEADLDRLLSGADMNGYLEAHPQRMEALARTVQHTESTVVSIQPGADDAIASTSARLQIDSPDRAGMLFVLTQTLFVLGYDILRFEAATEGGEAHDSFEVRKASGQLMDATDRMLILTSLREHL